MPELGWLIALVALHAAVGVLMVVLIERRVFAPYEELVVCEEDEQHDDAGIGQARA